MQSKDLFNQVLIEPHKAGATKLCVISGYATSAMVSYHLDQLDNDRRKADLKIHLVVGMWGSDGLPASYHRGFQKLVQDDYSDRFQCSYIYQSAPVHSKLYIWFKDNDPILSFAGSANYTQTGFGTRQREVLTECNATLAAKYFDTVLRDSIYCTHGDVDSLIRIYSDDQYFKRGRKHLESVEAFQAEPEDIDDNSFPCVRNSLLDRNGEVARRSGLNWGQRPDEGREPNQAYIPIKSSIYKTDFFPPRDSWFALGTDDNVTFLCKVSQDNGKAVGTPQSNSQLGEYFRRRLGVPSGALITRDHLEAYGRTDVVFCKLDDEHYTMDFSQ